MSEYELCVQLFEGEGFPGTLLNLPEEHVITLKALKKQISEGPHKGSKAPSAVLQPVWTKWASLSTESPESCQKDYVSLVISSIPVGAELTKQSHSGLNQQLSEPEREKLKQRMALAQKLSRIHSTGGVETTNEALGSSYVLADQEGEAFEKVTGEDGSEDDESAGSDEFGEVELSALASSQTHFSTEIPAESPRFMYRKSSIPIHDHEFQEQSALQKQSLATELEEEEFARSLRTSSIAQQIDDLAKFSTNSMTRIETLEKELALIRKELAQKDQQTHMLLVALSLLSVPSCLFVFWSLVRKSH